VIVYLVHAAGPSRVAQVLLHAGPWMPAIAALEFVQMFSDVVALRLILGGVARRIPSSTWVRSSAVSYAMMVLVPAGRAAGEVARGALFAPHIGVPLAATCGTQLQASYVFAIGMFSLVEMSAVAALPGPRSPLVVLLGLNAALMLAASAGLLAILWDARAGRWLERLRRRFAGNAEAVPLDPEARHRIPVAAACACCVGRTAQLAQYAVILSAVGGAVTLQRALVAHGLHLIGATLGDAVPGQLGVVDGTYRAFAAAVGFASAPERALSISFVAHATQLVLAGVCVLVAAVIRRGGEAAR